MSDETRRVMDEAAIRRVIDRYCHAKRTMAITAVRPCVNGMRTTINTSGRG